MLSTWGCSFSSKGFKGLCLLDYYSIWDSIIRCYQYKETKEIVVEWLRSLFHLIWSVLLPHSLPCKVDASREVPSTDPSTDPEDMVWNGLAADLVLYEWFTFIDSLLLKGSLSLSAGEAIAGRIKSHYNAPHLNARTCTPQKPNTTMENTPFEDVSQIKYGDFPVSC